MCLSKLDTARELSHPLRFRIWELCEREPGRSLAPTELHRDIAQKGEASVAQVSYQLRRLQRAGLVGGNPRQSR